MKKIKKRAKEVNIEDIFLDRAIKEREEEIQDMKIEVPLQRTNFFILIFLLFIVFGTFLFVTFSLQKKQEEYNNLAEQNKYVSLKYSSERGIIYDKNMIPLVENEASFDLYFNQDGSFDKVTQIFQDVSFSTSTETWILIKENLSHREVILFETKKADLPFLQIKKRILRRYESEGCLSHVLGYLGKITKEEFLNLRDYEFNDYIGKTGIENYYETILKEKKGTILIERTASGKEISRHMTGVAQSGDSITLSLDIEFQKQIEKSLLKVLEEVDSDTGSVIALNPSNGEILALVSYPAYDNNLFSKGISVEDWQELNQDSRNPQLNRVIGGVYPTGSAIKPVIGLAALEEGVIKEDTSIFCPKELCIENQYDSEIAECFPDWEYHGWSDIKRAIAESVNPFFYIIGGGYKAPKNSSKFFNPNLPRNFIGLGAVKIAKHLIKLGFSEKTGIDLPGEVEGRVPTPEWKEEYFSTALSQKWYLGDTYNLSIGQGYFLSTPLQLAVAFSGIVNNGIIYKPHFLKSIIRDEITQDNEAVILKENIANEETLNIIKQGMRQTVTSGSAVRLNSLSVTAGAKTGTAQVYSKSDIYHNWIVVFAPYENPEIVIVVLIEKVKGLKLAAQKVAQEVLEWYFTKIDL